MKSINVLLILAKIGAYMVFIAFVLMDFEVSELAQGINSNENIISFHGEITARLVWSTIAVAVLEIICNFFDAGNLLSSREKKDKNRNNN